MSSLRTDLEGRVLTVTLDRPQARNALDRDLILALTALARDIASDDAVDVVVVTGADPAFCAGLDVKQLEAEGAEFLRLADAENLPLTLLTAVNQAFFMGFFFLVSGYFTPGSYDRKGSLLVGDVDPHVAAVAGALTPVPGGVGPLTRAMLMKNTVIAAEQRLTLRKV